jgi:hypothetical protein
MTPVCVICELCCQGRSSAWLLHPSHFTSKKRGGKCLEVFAVCYDNVVLALNSLQTHTSIRAFPLGTPVLGKEPPRTAVSMVFVKF